MKRFKLLLASALLFFASCMGGEQIYVSADGTKDGEGTVESPVSFEEAIARSSKMLKTEGLPSGGLTITLADGFYRFNHPFTLGDEFKGSKNAPITITAATGAKVLFDGSKMVQYKDFSKVTDNDEINRLAASAKDKIYVATIKDEQMIKSFSDKLMVNLIIDGKEYLPSVFPNDGYSRFARKLTVAEIYPPAIPVERRASGIRAGTGDFQEKGKPFGWKGTLDEPRGGCAKFDRADEMAGSWKQWEDELKYNNARNQVTGFVEADWLLSSQPIYAVDSKKEYFHLSRATAYGWTESEKPFRVFGMLCELDKAGEWHFDIKTNKLYIYPTSPLTEKTNISLAVANGFIKMSEKCSYVNLIGLSVQNVGSGTIYQMNGDNNLIAGATICSSTARGVYITGTKNRLQSCDLIDLNSHVVLSGGSRSADGVVDAGNMVENCQFYHKNYKHEKINIAMNGAGNIFRHNLVHNSIGQAMVVNGNNQLVEYNEFFNVGHEEGDGGAIYSGADLAGYGNTYRYNFFHHLIHFPGKVERAGIHLDDGQSGATCYGNVFYKSAGKGLFAFGGSGHKMYDNVFLEGYRGAYFVISLGERMLNVERIIRKDPKSYHVGSKEDYVGRVERTIGKEGWNKPAWKEAYPLFAEIMSDTTIEGRLWPTHYTIKNNFSYQNKITDIADYRVSKESLSKSTVEPYREVKPEDFVDYNNMNFEFKDKTKFVDIPFSEIGLEVDKYRTKTPDKNRYRMAIKDFYKDVKSMPGTRKGFDSSSLVN